MGAGCGYACGTTEGVEREKIAAAIKLELGLVQPHMAQKTEANAAGHYYPSRAARKAPEHTCLASLIFPAKDLRLTNAQALLEFGSLYSTGE